MGVGRGGSGERSAGDGEEGAGGGPSSAGSTITAVQAAMQGPLEIRDVSFAYPMRPKTQGKRHCVDVGECVDAKIYNSRVV